MVYPAGPNVNRRWKNFPFSPRTGSRQAQRREMRFRNLPIGYSLAYTYIKFKAFGDVCLVHEKKGNPLKTKKIVKAEAIKITHVWPETYIHHCQ